MKLRATYALLGLLATAVIACGPPPSKTTAKKVGKDDVGIDPNNPKQLGEIKFVESDKGEPAVVGCADGQREGFADLGKYPTIAGCMGVWEEKVSLRKPGTRKACGDDLELCGAPSDVCAEGWHVCARDGDYHDLSDRVDGKSCRDGAGPGRFNAAISHVKKKKECPAAPGPNVRYPCLKDGWGSEPVCCGADCTPGKCRDAVWDKQTAISRGTSEGCGALSSERNGGVLCCKDADKPRPVIPAAPVDGATPAEGTAAPTDAVPSDDAKADDAKADDKKSDNKSE